LQVEDDSVVADGGLSTGPTTVADSAPRRRRLTAAGLETVETTPEAMRADEIGRARLYYCVIVSVIAVMLLALPWIEGDPTAKWVFAGGLMTYVASMTWFVLLIRDPAQYCLRNLYVVGVIGAVVGYTGVYYVGVFSPAPALIVMVLYMNSLVGSVAYTSVVYGMCAGFQGLLACLVVGGAIDDRGLIRPQEWSLLSQVITQALIQAVFLATFLIARLSRRTTVATIEKLEGAVRAVAERDALLNEARQELARAAWAGNPGRFTDQKLGSFELGVILGRGAMGEIYEAEHHTTGAPAAIKLLHRNVLANPEHVARFAREARAVVNVESPHVVSVLEVSGEDAPVPYLAMERLSGSHLGQVLQHKRRLELREVVELVQQVGAGIDAARAADIVHRDLKPQNLFRAETRGQPSAWKILDFGVSTLAQASGTLTQGQAIGTPTYMSPEQARGKPVDYRTDVYALGAIAYRALTGHPAFSGAEVPSILHDVVFRVPVRPSALADVPEDIDLVLALALAKRREDRFDSGGELGDAMLAAVRGGVDDELRRRAERAVARYPWGKTLN
jgi:serine/threonine-protein kinase